MSFWFAKKKEATASSSPAEKPSAGKQSAEKQPAKKQPPEKPSAGKQPAGKSEPEKSSAGKKSAEKQPAESKISEATTIDGLLLPADIVLPAARNAAAAISGTLSSSASADFKEDNRKSAATPSPTTSLLRPQQSQKVLYYQFMNGLYDAILIMGDHGHVIDCNQRVTPTLGYEREEMWNKHVSEFVKGITPKIFADMTKALGNNRQVLITARCTRKDGTSFLAEVGVSTMELNGHNLVFAIRSIEKRLSKMRIRSAISQN